MEKQILNEQTTALITTACAELAKSETLQKITDADTARRAQEFSVLYKKIKDQLDKRRLELTKPARDEQARINNPFAEVTGPLEARSKRLIQMAAEYERERLAAAKEETRKRVMAQAQAVVENKPMPVAEPAPVVESMVRMRDHWTHEVIDMSLVPREYLMIDVAKINVAIRAGITEIPGLIIKNEPIPVRSI